MNEKTMINFNNSYESLPKHFYSKSQPAVFNDPKLICFNHDLACDLLNIDLSTLSDTEKAQYFSGQKIFDGSSMISTAYSGHQFGHFNPTLGDGRATLIGEVDNGKSQHFDIQLKGSGPTKYSRQGDGLSALGPVLREYLVSEAMHALNIPTTRSLCAVESSRDVYREQVLPGAVLTRVAKSHLRIGTFEYFASREDIDGLRTLADYAIHRHYPSLQNHSQKYLELVRAVASNWSKLIAKWMSVGFIHGVMNTDNMSICGETIDYGPCAFMDIFKANQVYSFIDRQGRYAYNNQINIGKWNLARFASALLPIINEDESLAVNSTNQVLESLYPLYDQQYLEIMASKLGLVYSNEHHSQMISEWLNFLESNKLDFTQSFYKLSHDPDSLKQYKNFADINQRRLNMIDDQEHAFILMKEINPCLIPRNHQIEQVIKEAQLGQYDLFHELHQALKQPFVPNLKFVDPPTIEQEIQNTFCGT